VSTLAAERGFGTDPLPVCLHNENPNRLVSLWDIVKQFNLAEVVMSLNGLRVWIDLYEFETYKNGPIPVTPEAMEKVRTALKRLEEACVEADFDDAYRKILLSYLAMDRLDDSSGLNTELSNIEQAVLYEMFSRTYIQIATGNEEYLDRDMLFGKEVGDAFPNASRDIKESGNCLATESGTACVFHLMRAAEFSLRALARDRNVEFKDKPLDEKEWGQILGALETKVSALRSAARKCWGGGPELRERQIGFYNEVVQELRGFNDAWRRHVSHADAQAFYERDDAMGIFKHVRTFMQKLAANGISETSTREEYWTAL